MASQFSKECLSNMFEFCDEKTLYYCLFVNHEWLVAAVPTLWADPFGECLSPFDEDEEVERFERKSIFLIRTYVSCLSENIRVSLFGENSKNTMPTSIKPMFDYGSFLQNLDYYQLYNLVGLWLEETQMGLGAQKSNTSKCDLQNRLQTKVTRELCRLFVAQSIGIKQLRLHTKLRGPFGFESAPAIVFTEFPGAVKAFDQLEYLQCIVEKNFSEVFGGLANICHNIRDVEVIEYRQDNQDFANLIGAQKRLTGLDFFSGISQTPLITQSLGVKAHSLLELRLTGNHSIPLNIFNTSQSLYSLELVGDYKIADFRKLSESSFKCLHSLSLSLENMHIKELKTILRNTHGNLKDIDITWNLPLSPKVCEQVIEAIRHFCPGALSLELSLEQEAMKKIPSLLKSLTSLESLTIIGKYEEENMGFKFNDLLAEVGDNLPCSLHVLDLSESCWIIDGPELENFLTQCEVKLNVPLYLELSHMTDEILEIGRRYQKKGILRENECMKTYIPNQGIRIEIGDLAPFTEE
ncbi:hypothetical protein G9A89_017712 [Geosiphon pyriformis]|nr:hypothetical protein G9A89_017712 [Geosiphon pyriformis]